MPESPSAAVRHARLLQPYPTKRLADATYHVTATANGITPGTAAASGTAAWFRVLQSDGVTAVFDGSVGTSAANLNLSATAITAGQAVSISSFTITENE